MAYSCNVQLYSVQLCIVFNNLQLTCTALKRMSINRIHLLKKYTHNNNIQEV